VSAGVDSATGERTEGLAVAFCGTRGLPASYGGFETAVDEISKRFVERGRECVVFCRARPGAERPDVHEGRRLAYVRGSGRRSLDTFVSAFWTGVHLLRNRDRYERVFWFNNANLPGILLTLLAGIPVSVNTDGLEWRRAKWSWPFKAYYFLSSLLISLVCGSVISDSTALRSYYGRVFRKETDFVPYGAPEDVSFSPERKAAVLGGYGVEEGRYFLQITRFEPDNLPLRTAEAFAEAGLAEEGIKLLLVGYQQDTPYAKQIKALSGHDGIDVADAVYDPEVLAVLRARCLCYVHGNSAGGTNPALLEAMVSCPKVLAVDGPFSREVLGETGYFFEPGDMAGALRNVLRSPARSEEMRARVRGRYDWEEVAGAYERVLENRPANYLASMIEERSGKLDTKQAS
jgi:glycosyltransferase involved in cell wall biosynthesis